MAVDVRSEVVVTSGDIAQALFSRVQQDLVTQHIAIVAERSKCYKDAESFANNWLLSRFDAIRASEKWTVVTSWLAQTNMLLGTNIDIEPSIDGQRPSYGGAPLSAAHQLLDVHFWRGSVQWTALELDHVFKQEAVFIDKDDIDGEEFIFGKCDLSFGEYVDTEFCAELNGRFKHIRMLDNESERLKALINGEKSAVTGLSVHEQIQASITTQAINTVPQLKAAFDIDALTVGVKQLLLPSASGA